MGNLLNFYHHLPYHLNPIIFSMGSFRLEWYPLMYLVAFGVAYILLRYRMKKEPRYQIFGDSLDSFFICAFMGLIIGARLGYVLFYNLPFYWQHPLAIVSPFDPMNHEFIGIYGMSYHGGLIGAILASALFAKKYRVNFWRLANFTTPAIPAGYFFGRLGNFLNGELYGRITSSAWGMYFSNAIAADGFSSPQLRHPSQLYEAFLEGFVLFAILWPLRNNPKYEDKLFGLYLCGYASARILAEFFRQPDSQIGFLFGFMTLGQLISLIMFVSGLIVIGMEKKQEQC